MVQHDSVREARRSLGTPLDTTPPPAPPKSPAVFVMSAGEAGLLAAAEVCNPCSAVGAVSSRRSALRPDDTQTALCKVEGLQTKASRRRQTSCNRQKTYIAIAERHGFKLAVTSSVCQRAVKLWGHEC